MVRKTAFALAGIAALGLTIPFAVQAQKYPERPIRLVVPFPPGCNRRFQCVSAPEGESEAVMLFVIGGDAPAAAFSDKAYERIAEVPAPA